MSNNDLPEINDNFINQLLSRAEARTFECKRVGKVDRLLESVVAFSNTDGGLLALGLEDPDKAKGRDRVYGIQTHPMNWDELQRKLRQHLREFPDPPNLDAGEGVRMMFGTMRESGLYPPIYFTRPNIEREAVRVFLLNENRPSVWEQVSEYLDQNGSIGNAEVRQIQQATDTLGVSKQLKSWVGQGLLIVANPDAGPKHRRYTKSGAETDNLFSIPPGK